MIFLKILQILIWFVIIPYILGFLLNKKNEEKLYTWLLGNIILMATFMVISIPMILTKTHFHVLEIIYFIIIGILILISIILNRKEIIKFKFENPKSISVFKILMILLVVIQVFMKINYTITNYDDSYFVAVSNQMIDNGKMYYTGNESVYSRKALAPLSAYYSTISQYLFIHVTIVIHTIFPILFVLMSNVIYYYLGKKLFKEEKDSPYIFVIFMSLINVYFFNSKGAGSYFSKFTWLGRSILGGILLPLIWKVSLEAMNKDKNKVSDWITILIVVLASCLTTEMSIAICAISIGVLSLIASIRDKKPSYLLKAFGTVLPCLLLAIIYIFIK